MEPPIKYVVKLFRKTNIFRKILRTYLMDDPYQQKFILER